MLASSVVEKTEFGVGEIGSDKTVLVLTKRGQERSGHFSSSGEREGATGGKTRRRGWEEMLALNALQAEPNN